MGLCYYCRIKGHLARACPSRPARPVKTQESKIEEVGSSGSTSAPTHQELVEAQLAGMTEEAREGLIMKMFAEKEGF